MQKVMPQSLLFPSKRATGSLTQKEMFGVSIGCLVFTISQLLHSSSSLVIPAHHHHHHGHHGHGHHGHHFAETSHVPLTDNYNPPAHSVHGVALHAAHSAPAVVAHIAPAVVAAPVHTATAIVGAAPAHNATAVVAAPAHSAPVVVAAPVHLARISHHRHAPIGTAPVVPGHGHHGAGNGMTLTTHPEEAIDNADYGAGFANPNDHTQDPPGTVTINLPDTTIASKKPVKSWEMDLPDYQVPGATVVSPAAAGHPAVAAHKVVTAVVPVAGTHAAPAHHGAAGHPLAHKLAAAPVVTHRVLAGHKAHTSHHA